MSNHGDRLAQRVREICTNSYLADLVVESPKFTKDSGYQLEAGDLFLVLRGCLIVFQIKSRSVRVENGQIHVQETLRIEKRAKAAVKQIKTIKRAIDAKALEEHTNLRGVKIPFLGRRIEKLIGVAICGVEDAESGLPLENAVEVVGGFDENRGIPVHVFDVANFETLVNELDTIPDLVHYLDIREQLYRGGRFAQHAYERDLLSLYLTQFPELEAILQDERTRIVVQPRLWEQTFIENSAKFAARNERKLNSRIVDGIIAALHRTIGVKLADEIGKADGLPENVASATEYIEMVEELASLNRVARMGLAPLIREKMEKADTDPKGFSYYAMRFENSETAFLFIAHRGSRKDRFERLDGLSSLLYLHMKVKRVFGVATSSFSFGSRSFDFTLLQDASWDNEEELRALASEFFKPMVHQTQDQWGE